MITQKAFLDELAHLRDLDSTALRALANAARKIPESQRGEHEQTVLLVCLAILTLRGHTP